ncbi:4519_t:CDS:2 [Gigaspora margarita]|uniref:4519_t:CDS:1 n=1 Tax=Gigaspora margarita TaxID=4874 RepID=A0ABN7UQN3_GIGMA|nr:4519_t:CDS:2 [Gigaspora margarita]
MTKDLHPENVSEKVWKQLTRLEIQSLQLMNHINDNSTLKNGLFVAYAEYMQQCKYIKEEEESYAIIRAIFTYKYNDGLINAFIWIDWLKNIERSEVGIPRVKLNGIKKIQ